MDPVIQTLITAFAGFLASSAGFWAFLRQRTNDRDRSKDATTRLLMGLAQREILYQAQRYIDRGWITRDEYQDLLQYLYEPYSDLGGNGTAERMMLAVQKLPIRSANTLIAQPIDEVDPPPESAYPR